MADAIDDQSRVNCGFASVADVTTKRPRGLRATNIACGRLRARMLVGFGFTLQSEQLPL